MNTWYGSWGNNVQYAKTQTAANKNYGARARSPSANKKQGAYVSCPCDPDGKNYRFINTIRNQGDNADCKCRGCGTPWKSVAISTGFGEQLLPSQGGMWVGTQRWEGEPQKPPVKAKAVHFSENTNRGESIGARMDAIVRDSGISPEAAMFRIRASDAAENNKLSDLDKAIGGQGALSDALLRTVIDHKQEVKGRFNEAFEAWEAAKTATDQRKAEYDKVAHERRLVEQRVQRHIRAQKIALNDHVAAFSDGLTKAQFVAKLVGDAKLCWKPDHPAWGTEALSKLGPEGILQATLDLVMAESIKRDGGDVLTVVDPITINEKGFPQYTPASPAALITSPSVEM